MKQIKDWPTIKLKIWTHAMAISEILELVVLGMRMTHHVTNEARSRFAAPRKK